MRPGKNIVSFVCVCNFILWIMYTFQAEKFCHNPIMTSVYGQIPWAFMVRSALPLMIFFRFHSIDVIGKIWSEVYEQECEDEETCERPVVYDKRTSVSYEKRRTSMCESTCRRVSVVSQCEKPKF